ncbi:hypothetical protein PENCOP_c003G05060 [Penicillium coprophilum]|uniref:Uncharacterized protein n=1 Tax=Penicillium coprophilum TaxID=36646 RepID=A0A1V6UXG7_9EURO|nr:hypothetical protein PENCOP_c003G05060 [Penicillium coprophilum]
MSVTGFAASLFCKPVAWSIRFLLADEDVERTYVELFDSGDFAAFGEFLGPLYLTNLRLAMRRDVLRTGVKRSAF